MSKKSRSQIEIETNFIRQYMENNLEVGKSHHEICKELNISQRTYFRHVKRIMNEDSKIWDKVHFDSAQYRAVRLMEALQNTSNICKQIMNDPKTKPNYRIEAAKTLCLSEAHIFKIISEGPSFSFHTSLPIVKDNNHQLTDNETN